jgi:hypothetical protein
VKQGAQTTQQSIRDHVAPSTCSTADTNTRQFFRSDANAFLPAFVSW